MADAGTLYSFAHQFYWDFRRIAEGRTRVCFDHKRFAKLKARIRRLPIRMSDANRKHIAGLADEEVRSGRLPLEGRADWIHNAQESQVFVDRDWLLERAAERCRFTVRVLGEADVITELLAAQTVEEVRLICDDAFSEGPRQFEPGITRTVRLPNWPISVGSVLPTYLSQYASAFIAARRDPRFPKSSKRPSSRLKQLWFLSRALAGALYGVSTRTAINLVGSMRPEEMFEESRDGKPARRHMRARTRSRRSN